MICAANGVKNIVRILKHKKLRLALDAFPACVAMQVEEDCELRFSD
jgi:hypothetical protein